MVALQRGGNAPVASTGEVRLVVTWPAAPSELDVACFVVSVSGNVPSDEHMVFYNQPSDPSAAVVLVDRSTCRAELRVNLDAVRPDVARCVVTATLDGPGTFGEVQALTITAQAATGEAVSYRVDDVSTERALIVGELYRHASGWKLRAIGQGFRG